MQLRARRQPIAIFGLGFLALSVALVALPGTAQGSSQDTKASQSAEKEEPKKVAPESLRDPFRSPLQPQQEAVAQQLPPGKEGLVISQLSVDGIVLAPAGRIAVVTMRGRNRAYFLRLRDRLYDGRVLEITEIGVVFRETAVDAFGKRYDRRVVKELSGATTSVSTPQPLD